MQERTEKSEKQPSNAGELVIGGVAAILSAIPITSAFGAIGSYTLLAWQGENLKKFIQEFRQRIAALDETKLDKNALNSDEFKSLVVMAVETAANSASDLKRRAIAQALVNFTVVSSSELSCKSMLMRILNQLSEEEIQVLSLFSVLYEPFSSGLEYEYIAEKLEWEFNDLYAVSDGLVQLGLAKHENDMIISPRRLYLTSLAYKLTQSIKIEMPTNA
jgi:hypothetical protein